ncbi:MAG TPA: FAD-linked oxidase C-terminal domain-containing protein [Candidatus Obscuribacterales bacterium]
MDRSTVSSNIYKNLEPALREIVGRDYVLTSRADLAVYECDAETLDVARPDMVVLPSSTEEVAAVVRLLNENGVSFTPRGAATGLSGGATTVMGGVSLVLTRMTRVIEIDPYDQVAVVEVGVTNLSVSDAAKRHGLYFAPDPSSQSASTIGGNLSENSGGPHTLKYGMTINHVLGVKLVLPDGRVTVLGGRSRYAPGLDLLGVFVGSEGTLGIATEATLRLLPRPHAVETMLAYFPSVGAGGRAVSDIVAAGVVPAAMEMIDKLTLNAVEDYLGMGLNRHAGALLIVELDGSEAGIHVHREVVENCLRKNDVISVDWAKDESQRAKIWKARKTSFGALGRIAPHGYVLDGVIPRSRLAESIERITAIGDKYNVVVANVYHAGDGNLHPCILYHRDNVEEVARVMKAAKEILLMCVELGGTLSGEHGIGIEKVEEMPLAFTEAELEAMRWVKESFNQKGLLNPGKIIPLPKTCGESGMRPLLRHTLLSTC